MKIYYLSDSEIPSRRANSVHVMKMCDALAAGGHTVTLLAYWRGDRDVYASYDVRPRFSIAPYPNIRVPGPKRLTRALAAARRVRARPRPDLLYGRDVFGLLAASGSGVPFVFEAHTPPQNRVQAFCIAKLLAAEGLVRLVVISNALARRYLTLYPWFPPERMLVAHDAADERDSADELESNGRTAAERAAAGQTAAEQTGAARAAASAWPGRPDVPQIGYVGSLYRGKGAEIAVALAQRLPAYDFHVLGGDDLLAARLRGGYGGRNLFMHGHIEHRRIAACLARLDIALLPAQRNVKVTSGADIGEWMSPLKLFEYMSHGLAIVASSLPVIGEVLVHDSNALLAPPDDLDAWAAAVDRLCKAPDLRERLGKQALRDFHASYTWRKRSKRVLDGLPTAAEDVGALSAEPPPHAQVLARRSVPGSDRERCT